MKKTAVIHQPDFIPYLGFFQRLLSADVFVILDDVQFLRRGWHHRDKIKTPNGEQWLSIGTVKTAQATNINQIRLSNTNWRQEHLNILTQNYKKADFFHEIFPIIKGIYEQNHLSLFDFNFNFLKILFTLFDINVEIEFSSTFDIHTTSNQRIVDILNVVHATHYLSGIGARNYYDPKPYKQAGISVIWQAFEHPIYPQLYGQFIPYLSCIDILFNCGIIKSREILRSCK
ncbi:MAG: WbqC family protein [Arcobacteraceae bacterium]